MPARFICPHCHHSIDPLTLEAADCADGQYRICPECDEPIVLSDKREDTSESPPIISSSAAASPIPAFESLAQ